MKKNNRLGVVALLLFASVGLGACNLVAKQADVATETPTVTLQGKIYFDDDGVYLLTRNERIELSSRKVDLRQYVERQVEVIGEYSGSTLYVDEIK